MSRLTEVDASVGIVDDRVAMSADSEADLYLKTPDRQPLGAIETHATLRISGPDYRAEVDLDRDALQELTAALQEATD